MNKELLNRLKSFIDKELQAEDQLYLFLFIAFLFFLLNAVVDTQFWFYIFSIFGILFLFRAIIFYLFEYKVFTKNAFSIAYYLLCLGKYDEAKFWLWFIKRNFWQESFKGIKFNKKTLKRFRKIKRLYKKRNLHQKVRIEHFDNRILYILKQICLDHKDLHNQLSKALEERENFIKAHL